MLLTSSFLTKDLCGGEEAGGGRGGGGLGGNCCCADILSELSRLSISVTVLTIAQIVDQW